MTNYKSSFLKDKKAGEAGEQKVIDMLTFCRT